MTRRHIVPRWFSNGWTIHQQVYHGPVALRITPATGPS